MTMKHPTKVEIATDEAGVYALLSAFHEAREWHIISEAQFKKVMSMASDNLRQLAAGYPLLTFDDQQNHISLKVTGDQNDQRQSAA